MSSRDRLFTEGSVRNEDFTFGKDTAAVFDDTLDRSVSLYGEIQRMPGELSADFAADGTTIYDRGCSTGNTVLAVGGCRQPDLNVRLVGLDSSGDMLREGERKLAGAQFPWPCTLTRHDLNDGLRLTGALTCSYGSITARRGRRRSRASSSRRSSPSGSFW